MNLVSRGEGLHEVMTTKGNNGGGGKVDHQTEEVKEERDNSETAVKKGLELRT